MVTRSRNNKLLPWEVRLVKSMLEDGGFGNDQDILAYFTRPNRSINHRAIAEIRTQTRHARAVPASEDTLAQFLRNWPQIDTETGLHIFNDELLIKSREVNRPGIVGGQFHQIMLPLACRPALRSIVLQLQQAEYCR